MMRGMEIGKRLLLAEKRTRNTADLRKDIRFILEWHLSIDAILSEGNHNNNGHLRTNIYTSYYIIWLLGARWKLVSEL